MIRRLDLVCSKCNNVFSAQKELYYQEDFKEKNFNDVKFICSDCLEKWQEYWQVKQADFWEKDGVLYTTINLLNGEQRENITCTAMNDIVVIDEDIPLEAKQKLYGFYKKWYDEKMKDYLKTCSFKEEFMRTSFTCETYGGDIYTDVAFRFNRLGILETEKEVPDKIKEQVVSAWNVYELSNIPIENLNDE